MKILFGCGWAQSRSKIFKEKPPEELFQKYSDRLQKQFICSIAPLAAEQLKDCPPALWICERSKNSRMLASDELAVRLQKVCDSGVKQLTIWVGGPDGLTKDQLATVRTDLLWSFGPLTLPHELAMVIAAEQVYRATTILKNHPYHSGH